MPTVVLDAGHGGYDLGAVNGTRYEKNDNLRMTLAVGEILKNCGINVVYTRSTDVFVPLLERSRISNNARADLFVSIHRNSSVLPNANGFENHVYVRPSSTAVAMANYILDRVVAVGVQSNRGIMYSNFSVIRETNAPAVLIELGFISNTLDNQLFDQNFNGYANAIAGGILRTLGINCEGVTIPVPPTPGPPPAPPVAPAPPPGDYTATIRYIQSTLNSRYNTGLTVDGIWGPMSYRALIKGFQTELNKMFNAGLVVDGVWGPRTRAATPNLRLGDRGNLVWILQAALYVNGFPVTIDSDFGSQTDTFVRAFQRTNGLTADGIAGPNTFEKLFARA